MYRLLIAILLVQAACHDQVQSPEMWTIREIHRDIGLTGGHQLACAQCHGEASFKSVAAACEGCHLPAYEATASPNHRENGYPTLCTECHESTAWRPAFVAHDTLGFPLEGGHARIFCSACHADNIFTHLPTDCFACHEENFNTTAEPNHIESQFSHACTECHTTAAWKPATFDHDRTDFPLTGVHVETACAACHVDGVFENTPSDCFACHEENFNATAEPNHVESQFSHTCTECHTTAAWKPTTFDHDQTDFPLTGAHVETACAACHVDGVFENTPSDCFACHERDEPENHFGPDCAACHSTTAWEPSSFNHEPLFPLLRGNHSHYRTRCQSCHLDLTDYAAFTCTGCHDGEHSRNRTDRRHRNVRNYVYESGACYRCHPRGN